MTAPLYVWYRGAFVAIGTNAHMQEERQKRSSMKNIVDGGEQIFENNVL